MSQQATPTMQQEVDVYREENGSSAAAAMETGAVQEQQLEDVKSQLNARLEAAFEEFVNTPQTQIAEPQYWWDLYAYGPVQPGAGLGTTFVGPLLPHQVIRVGETAYVATILLLNSFFPSPGPSAAEVLSKFALPYEIRYNTGELTHWQPAGGSLQHTSNGNLVPGRPWAVDIFSFRAREEGLFEMNISARIYGCRKNVAPPFAGYATRIVEIDRDMFGTGPRTKTEEKVRFQIYR